MTSARVKIVRSKTPDVPEVMKRGAKTNESNYPCTVRNIWEYVSWFTTYEVMKRGYVKEVVYRLYFINSKIVHMDSLLCIIIYIIVYTNIPIEALYKFSPLAANECASKHRTSSPK